MPKSLINQGFSDLLASNIFVFLFYTFKENEFLFQHPHNHLIYKSKMGMWLFRKNSVSTQLFPNLYLPLHH
nr:MAG TPA: hypothetical protein [Caudoviricetes sp.]